MDEKDENLQDDLKKEKKLEQQSNMEKQANNINANKVTLKVNEINKKPEKNALDNKEVVKQSEKINSENDQIKSEEQNVEQKKNEAPKYVPYSPVIKNKKTKKGNKVIEKPDIEKEFYRLKRKRKRQIIIILGIILILLTTGIFCTGFAVVNMNNTKILSGISIRNIEVGGLTKEEAISALQEQLNYEKTKEIQLNANGEVLTMTLEQIEIEYLIEDAVNKAYEIGRNGNIFQNNFAILKSMNNKQNIDLEIKYNEELLDNIMNTVGAKLPNAMSDNTYNVEDEELVITRGTAGLVLDNEQNKEKIIEVAKTGNFDNIELATKHQECPEIDIDKIYAEVHTEPQDAYYTTNPFQIYPHKNGIDFDVEAAKALIKEDSSKEEYVIELKITAPNVLTNQIGSEAFPDLLSSFSTKYDQTNKSRSTNLGLAASKINGTIVMPGEVFSYNKTVGKRTVEAGYKEANGFAGGRVVPMLGGGICQVSSTLYDAVLYANLNIVERHNHMFQATYVEPGKDATVVYGSLDFNFENTRKYPVRIQASAKSGLLEVKIFGIKEEVEYDVEIVTKVLSYTPYKVIYETDSSLGAGKERVAQYGIQGCKSITYKIVKQNGVEIEKTVLSSDTYDPQNKIIKRGSKQAASTKPATPTTQTTTPETTVPQETPTEQKPTTQQATPTQTTPSTPAGEEAA